MKQEWESVWAASGLTEEEVSTHRGLHRAMVSRVTVGSTVRPVLISLRAYDDDDDQRAVCVHLACVLARTRAHCFPLQSGLIDHWLTACEPTCACISITACQGIQFPIYLLVFLCSSQNSNKDITTWQWEKIENTRVCIHKRWCLEDIYKPSRPQSHFLMITLADAHGGLLNIITQLPVIFTTHFAWGCHFLFKPMPRTSQTKAICICIGSWRLIGASRQTITPWAMHFCSFSLCTTCLWHNSQVTRSELTNQGTKFWNTCLG